jgi:hypothetical protein
MFDLRYHVASLAAVFIALVIGILVGVGISSRGVISNPERSLLNQRIADLQARLDATSARASLLGRQQTFSDNFVADAYPALVHNRLAGKRIALVFVGSVDAGMRSSIEQTIADAGGRPLLRVRAIKVPIDAAGVLAAVPRSPLAVETGKGELRKLGEALGREFVLGKDTHLWDALTGRIVEEQDGRAQPRADGVVVVRTAGPQQGSTARFLSGFYSGLAAAGKPSAAVETSKTVPSTLGAFDDAGLSTIDDVDTSLGRLALVLVLSGAGQGRYGEKPAATDGVLPPLLPLHQGA